MLVAKVKIKLSKDADVIKENVTPAEAAFYAAEHQKNAGGIAVQVVGEPDEVERTDEEEVARLYRKLPTKKIKKLYPNTMARLPETFEKAIQFGMGVSLPVNKLMEFNASNS